MGKSKAYQHKIKDDNKQPLQHPEQLLYSNDTEDNTDIPLEIINLAVQISPKHLHDLSAKRNFNITKLQKHIDSPHKLVV